MALTGDLLFVGDVGRPDLTGNDTAQTLAANLYDSLFRTAAEWPDHLVIYPAHGAGSLCGRSIAGVRVSSLGFERRYNPALAATDREQFIYANTHDLPEQPGNHTAIKATNRRGPAVLGEIAPQPLTLDQAIPYFRSGAGLLDVRAKAAYIQKHIPGSAHLEFGPQLSNRASFVLHPNQPQVMLLDDPAQYVEVVYALARVGYENVVGYLANGLAEWEAAGYPVSAGDIQDVQPAELQALLQSPDGQAPLVIDVREPWEFAQGRIPGARLDSARAAGGAARRAQPTAPSGSRVRSRQSLADGRSAARARGLRPDLQPRPWHARLAVGRAAGRTLKHMGRLGRPMRFMIGETPARLWCGGTDGQHHIINVQGGVAADAVVSSAKQHTEGLPGVTGHDVSAPQPGG